MTYSDQISSYVDSELSVEQEQEFLIALAANEGLRKTFRSDLVLKSVIHRDELMTAPPRDMRAAVFAAVGIGLGATALGSSRVEASSVSSAASSAPAGSASTMSLLKTLVTTKLGVALTAGSMLVGGLGGYAVHDGLSHNDATSVKPSTTMERTVAPVQESVVKDVPVQSPTTAKVAEHKAVKSHATKGTVNTDTKSTPMNVTGAPGTIEIDQSPAK